MAICRVDRRETPQAGRGVCGRCLRSIGQQVDCGETTWEKAEECGLCIPEESEESSFKLCLSGCEAKANARGLCRNCYASATNAMKAKNLQWPDLEQLGMSLPAKKKRTKGSSNFKTKFEAALAKERQVYTSAIEENKSRQEASAVQKPFLPTPLTKEEIEEIENEVDASIPQATEVHFTGDLDKLSGLSPPGVDLSRVYAPEPVPEAPSEPPTVPGLSPYSSIPDRLAQQLSIMSPGSAPEPPEEPHADLSRVNAPEPVPEAPSEPSEVPGLPTIAEVPRSFPVPPTVHPEQGEAW